MERQNFELDFQDGFTGKLFVAHTNDLDPYKQIRELGLVIINQELKIQIDDGFNLEEIESLIKYLSDVRDYCKEFNANSKLREENK